MESKRRSTLDDPRLTASALRRLTPSPRLGWRRPSSTASSVSSMSSHDHDEPSSCVSRDSSHDDCALNRFMVWAAVKRNDCTKMTTEEKRECPLLRCRKRFSSHELMLQHLYTCDQLAAGEYWCYDCAKVECFSDARCRRCLGHPSKRKKIMFMAKNFFSSLGHRSKTGSLPDLDLDVDDGAPSFDDASFFEVPYQAELQSNEIHEIDSTEVILPTILEDAEEEHEAESHIVAPRPSMPISFHTIHPAELESRPQNGPPRVDMQGPFFPPRTVAPATLLNAEQTEVPDRPSLQLHTAMSDLDRYRAQAKRRSKMLAPSSSVRSTASTATTATTASTASTVSTNSMSSAASYNISPVSGWSGGWGQVPEFESTLTSPSEELFPDNVFDTSVKHVDVNVNMDVALSTMNSQFEQSFSTELPADVPMLGGAHQSDPLSSSFDLFSSSFSFDAGGDASVLSIDASLAASNNAFQEQHHQHLQHQAQQEQPPPLQQQRHVQPTSHNELQQRQAEQQTSRQQPYCQSPEIRIDSFKSNGTPKITVHTLVDTAWDALRLHVADSMAKLQHIKSNHIIDQLRSMSTETIASTALRALANVLDHVGVDSPVDLLCFVHLIYSFSLIIHEQDAASRGAVLFAQAVLYASRLSKADRQAYLPIVGTLWKPSGMTKSDIVGLIRTHSAASRSSSVKKGKRRHNPETKPVPDSLAFLAEFFLDEIEYATRHEPGNSEIQGSNLCVRHLKDLSLLEAERASSDLKSVTLILKILLHRHADSPKFVAGMTKLLERVKLSKRASLRRLELDIMHIGKTCLRADTFFDTYILQVRALMDPLYLGACSISPRSVYHKYGVELIDNIVRGVAPESSLLADGSISPALSDDDKPPAVSSGDKFSPTLASLETFDVMAADMGVFNFNDISGLETPEFLVFPNGIPSIIVDSSSVSPETVSSVPLPSSAATSPPSPNQPQSAGAKIESDSCCEICGYRPEGDPRWFPGSMAKHKKLQHATSPPKIYRCSYPGCTSQFKNRPDNLRQHQIKKGHFLEGEDQSQRRPNKRKKLEEDL